MHGCSAWVSRHAHPGPPALTLLPHSAGSGGHGTPLSVHSPFELKVGAESVSWKIGLYSSAGVGVWPQDPWKSSACTDPAASDPRWGARMAVHECLALHPSPSPMGRAGSVGLTGLRAAGRSRPCRRSTASRRVAVRRHVLSATSISVSPSPLVPSQAITVHFLITAAGPASQQLRAEQ